MVQSGFNRQRSPVIQLISLRVMNVCGAQHMLAGGIGPLDLAPFYWRWLAAHRQAARDGYPPFNQSELPRYNRPQPFEQNADTRQKVKEKLSAVRMKRYIDKGEVKSLTSYFGFPRETPT